ncbi:MAG: indolepyruvate oxidoreductase subunit beta [Syntrophomonadaceae bacterium]|jgi:indolepyruvate ferredoxin oxidoreductase beta subunit
MSNRTTNVLIVGVGGQGTLLTSRIIAQVAVQMGYDVKVSEVHGMAQRGGSVVSQVRYGVKVNAPIIKKGDADVILGFEKIETARWLDYLKKDGMVIINNQRVNPLPVMIGKAKYPDNIHEKIAEKIKKTFIVDASEIAARCGSIKAANVVLVGLLSGASNLPDNEVEKAIREIVPPKALDINLAAYKEGRRLFSQLAK